MQRVTITLDDDLMEDLDRMIAEHGYQNRSEAIRDFARAGMQQAAQKTGSGGECVAALVYVYDHAARDLSSRLVKNFHGHHDLSLATLHVHLDDDNCMEITALKGQSGEVQHFADHIIAERGVRYGRVVMIPTEDSKTKNSRTVNSQAKNSKAKNSKTKNSKTKNSKTRKHSHTPAGK